MHLTIWIISFLAIAGVIIRPFNIPEVFWALAGAIILILSGLILPSDGLNGILKGTDVYLFLTGMMLLAETAREEKLFDWLAAYATRLAGGSSKRLFLLIYLVGIVVTIFLSNDATAVVLTPAVAAAVKAAKVKNPLPYLLICAFIANAASFVLPISNPANLVIYGRHMPSLLQWVSSYILPSIGAILVTYFMLYVSQCKVLRQTIETGISLPLLSHGAKTAIAGLLCTAVILLAASAMGIPLGLPAAFTGIVTTAVVLIRAKKSPVAVIKGVSWSVLPLVASLFIIVEGLNKTGLTQSITALLHQSASVSISKTVWLSSMITAFACNLTNNLPAGLIVGNALQAGHLPEVIKSALLIGIDLGPNLSITGSLATILWLVVLRREKQNISAWVFLKIGFVVMLPALLVAIAMLFL